MSSDTTKAETRDEKPQPRPSHLVNDSSDSESGRPKRPGGQRAAKRHKFKSEKTDQKHSVAESGAHIAKAIEQASKAKVELVMKAIDDKIMLQRINNLDDFQKAYVNARRSEILKKFQGGNNKQEQASHTGLDDQDSD
ncbi:hypothetical protein DFH28DRAFT_935529 [Melampsora americana]|nr:hypothetical protein DFH28DRAFT_935529 [Melampsora americana]